MTQKKMFITDLDGTLFRPDQTLSDKDRKSLLQLKDEGIIRVAATGRSVFSLERSLREPLPVDYLIFSTGAGIARYPDPFQNIIMEKSLPESDTEYAAAFLDTLDIDYMIQNTIPDNHIFSYRFNTNNNNDFLTRISYYKKYCTALDGNLRMPSSQLLVIVPDNKADAILKTIKNKLRNFSIIRATSPFDGKTVWIEILPQNTSKSIAAAWLTETLGITKKNTVAIGNDYNDEDLLSWAQKGYVVENAPAELKSRFKTVASNKNSGVSEAIKNAFETIF